MATPGRGVRSAFDPFSCRARLLAPPSAASSDALLQNSALRFRFAERDQLREGSCVARNGQRTWEGRTAVFRLGSLRPSSPLLSRTQKEFHLRRDSATSHDTPFYPYLDATRSSRSLSSLSSSLSSSSPCSPPSPVPPPSVPPSAFRPRSSSSSSLSPSSLARPPALRVSFSSPPLFSSGSSSSRSAAALDGESGPLSAPAFSAAARRYARLPPQAQPGDRPATSPGDTRVSAGCLEPRASTRLKWGSWTERDEGQFDLHACKKVEKARPGLGRRAAFLAAALTRGSMCAEDMQFACTEMAGKRLSPNAPFWDEVACFVVQKCHLEIRESPVCLQPSAGSSPSSRSRSGALSIRRLVEGRQEGEGDLRGGIEGLRRCGESSRAPPSDASPSSSPFVDSSAVLHSSLLSVAGLCATVHAFARAGVTPRPLASPSLASPSPASPSPASPSPASPSVFLSPPATSFSLSSASPCRLRDSHGSLISSACAGEIYALGAMVFSEFPFAFRGSELAVLTAALVKAGFKDKTFYSSVLDFLLGTPPSPSPSSSPSSSSPSSFAGALHSEVSSFSPGPRRPPVADMVEFLDFEPRAVATLLHALATAPVELPRTSLHRVFHLFSDYLVTPYRNSIHEGQSVSFPDCGLPSSFQDIKACPVPPALSHPSSPSSHYPSSVHPSSLHSPSSHSPSSHSPPSLHPSSSCASLPGSLSSFPSAPSVAPDDAYGFASFVATSGSSSASAGLAMPLGDLSLAALATVLRAFFKVRCNRPDLLEASRRHLEAVVLPSLARQAAEAPHTAETPPRSAVSQETGGASPLLFRAAVCSPRGMSVTQSLVIFFDIFSAQIAGVLSTPVAGVDARERILRGEAWGYSRQVNKRENKREAQRLHALATVSNREATMSPHAAPDSSAETAPACSEVARAEGGSRRMLRDLGGVLAPRIRGMDLGGVLTLCFALSRVAHLQGDLSELVNAIVRRARCAMQRAARDQRVASGFLQPEAGGEETRTKERETEGERQSEEAGEIGGPLPEGLEGQGWKDGEQRGRLPSQTSIHGDAKAAESSEDILVCRDVSNLAQTFARLNIADSDFLLALDAWLPFHSADLAPQDLVGILYAFRQLRHAPNLCVRDAVFFALFRATNRLLPSFTLQQLVTVLSSFSRLRGASVFPGAQATFLSVCDHLLQHSSLRFYSSSSSRSSPQSSSSSRSSPQSSSCFLPASSSLSSRHPSLSPPQSASHAGSEEATYGSQRRSESRRREGRDCRGNGGRKSLQSLHAREKTKACIELSVLHLVPLVGALGRMAVRHEPFFLAAGNFFCADGLDRAFVWDLQSLKDAYARVGYEHPELFAVIEKHLNCLPPTAVRRDRADSEI
ncbi:hypothetical protein TGRUB_232980 [Toxoplasma gondii RUB]|uniref:Uncharacterized protein n=1 Tax=Toxoplasma gondii RUB TaxID=935652 RepID=A0A086M4M0_TOXGO|nr:hypothetical protein TGRUB_232980 [Toxoplasma gondii RUB]